MTSHRADRVAQVMKEEISLLLQREVKDPRIGFVTVTHVEVTRDLHYAKVFISTVKGEAEKRSALRGLDSARGFIRGELGRRLTLRRVPELVFRLDETIERGVRISQLLRELNVSEPSSK